MINTLSTNFEIEAEKIIEVINYIIKKNQELMLIKSKFPELWEVLLDAHNLID